MSETEAVSRRAAPRSADTTRSLPTDETGHSSPPPPFQPGEVVGRYQIRGLLGAGGMGLVFTAFDPELERTVALKLIRPDGKAPSSRARTRLLREAQALAKLQHPNVVTIYDVGTDGDQVFIAMELINGQTLSSWLASAAHPWRTIRDVFLAAGRGLAAAHAVGIVHRDFKPSNVIVGTDRVVVVDFGLALARGADCADESSGPSNPSSILELNLTLTGERVGTPRYMAPEQHAADPVTAQADQFSFANALWSALYGVAPFVAESREDLFREMARGPTAPPAESKVPDRVRAALARALALRPDDRFPALSDLLAELTHDPVAVRRRLTFFGFAACAVLGVGATAFGLGRKASAPEPCASADAQVAALWDDATRLRTRDAFRQTGRPYADETFLRVDGSIRRRLGDWALAHRDACEATEVRHEQSAELLDARMACLAQSRTEISALVSLLSGVDAATLDRSVVAAASVGDVSSCSNLVALREAVAGPRDPQTARAVEEVRSEIAHVEALRLLGRMPEGLVAVRKAIAHARSVGNGPALAAALDRGLWFEVNTGNDDAGIADGYEAARLGAEARDDSLVASALTGITYALGFDEQRFESAEVAYQTAVAAAARAGFPGPVIERLYADRESVLYARGDFLTVLPLTQIVYALSVHLHGVDSYQAALSLSELADAVHRAASATAADPIFRRALATAEMSLTPDHIYVLSILNNAGVNRLDIPDYDGAAPYFQRALLVKEKTVGPNDPSVAISAHNLGIALRGQRRLPEARAAFERAIKIRVDKLGPNHPLLATSYGELAEVARLEGRLEEALEDLDQAIAIKRRAYTKPHPSLAESYRSRAEVLTEMGRYGEARAMLALVDDIFSKVQPEPNHRAYTVKVAADLLMATKRPREALPLYEQALVQFQIAYGKDGLGIAPGLLGLGNAQLAVGDTGGALATAEHLVAIVTYNSAQADLLWAAQFLLAQAQWAGGHDRGDALCLARSARSHLAALPYPATVLPTVDKWLASK